MEPWEALDVDDSDLPALLRPCKRQFLHHPPSSTCTANPFPQSPVSLSSQSQQEDLHIACQQQPSASTSKPSSQIPGPAGSVQAAMLRKSIDQRNRNFVSSQDNQMDGDNDGNNVIPTQEYIRRAMEDTSEFDEDFARNPWFCALEYLGTVNGVIPCTSVSSIKKCLDVGKVDKVVAVIKSCTPNGLGGLIVTLKDPTGTIGASIHHKVLTESEYGKDLTIGAALILEKVSIFKPLRSARHLNITLRNLIKVFGKENGPPSEKNFYAHSLQYADPGIDYGKASTTEKMSTSKNRRVENTPIESRQFNKRREDLIHNKNNKKGKENMLSGSFHCSNRTSVNLNVAVKKGALEKLAEDATRTGAQDHHHGFLTVSDERACGSNVQGSLINNSTVSNLEIQVTSGVEMQRQPMVKHSLPQWTDEQLDELFAADDVDGFLF